MFVEEKELTVVCIGLCGLTHTLHTHHVHQPRQVSQEWASVQPVVVARGCGMDLCRLQFALLIAILAILIFIGFFFLATAFPALTFCILSNLWIICNCQLWNVAVFNHMLVKNVGVVVSIQYQESVGPSVGEEMWLFGDIGVVTMESTCLCRYGGCVMSTCRCFACVMHSSESMQICT